MLKIPSIVILLVQIAGVAYENLNARSILSRAHPNRAVLQGWGSLAKT